MVTLEFTPIQQHESKRLLELSCKLYGEIENLYLELNSIQLSDTEKVPSLMGEIEKLKHRVQEIETQANEQLRNMRELPQMLASVLEMRKERIEKLLHLNKGIVENAQRYKALIQNEISDLHKTRNAMSGYKTTKQPSHNFIDGSC